MDSRTRAEARVGLSRVQGLGVQGSGFRGLGFRV